MAGFDAATVVDPLDYTFEPHVASHGTIPEPTDDQIEAFTGAMQSLMKEVQASTDMPGMTGDEGPEKFLEALDSLDPAKIRAQMDQMADVYALLCSGKPTADEIRLLPQRIRNRFFQWISKEVLNPEAGPGAGTAQVIRLPGAAAG
jgi:hypothetical protein